MSIFFSCELWRRCCTLFLNSALFQNVCLIFKQRMRYWRICFTLNSSLFVALMFTVRVLSCNFWSEHCKSREFVLLLWCVYDVLYSVSSLCADVHGVYSHGPACQEAEPESGGEREGAREGHGQHQLPSRQGEEEEREEMLLRERREGEREGMERCITASHLPQYERLETPLILHWPREWRGWNYC